MSDKDKRARASSQEQAQGAQLRGQGPMRLRVAITALVFGLSAVACATPEQVNCPDKYEGQTVTVAGKITKTASLLALATVSTLQDSKGNVCVAVTKSSIGNEGDSIRLERMVAVHDESTLFTNFLRRADENVAAGTSAPPAATAAPAGTIARATATAADVPIIKKIGEAATYVDGWKVSVTKAEEQAPFRFSTPTPGNRFITITVRYDNGTAKEGSFNLFDWKLQDSAGVRHDPSFFSDRSDGLHSGPLATGAFVVGTVTFEVPATDKQLKALYTGFTYKLATWELY